VVTVRGSIDGHRSSAFSTLATVPSAVVLQPTTLCNLDCSYCYLPFRRVDQRMSVEVAASVAGTVNGWAEQAPFDVIWHGGEPLAAGRPLLSALMAPFSGVRHHVQTNATLVDDAWCDLFATHDVRVGISIDGPAPRNQARVDRGGKPAFTAILRGIESLRQHALEFSAIAVVSDPDPAAAAELYAFFADLGCAVLGVNIEEQEGVNTRSNRHDPARVADFWAALTEAWAEDPVVKVREIERALGFVAADLDGRAFLPDEIDPFPTIDHRGDVTFISPELAGFSDERHGAFAVGNVMDTDLASLVARAASQPWVIEYRAGIDACRTTCPYFAFCGGAQPANRYFEQGRFDITRTRHCQNSRISLLEGVVEHARTLGAVA
jgi:uncharacterized protein